MSGYVIGGAAATKGPSNERLGNVTLKIESFDHQSNSATGTTRDGELMTIRLSNKSEFSEIFVNRTQHTTQDARDRVASKQTGNRLDTAGIQAKMDEGEGSIQFQDVRQTPQGELIARWMESIATTADDSYVSGLVRVAIPRSNSETAGKVERRWADVIQPETASAATMENLDSFTTNRVMGDDGKELEGVTASQVMISIQSADGVGNISSALVRTGWDKEAKRPINGGEALFDRPLNGFNVEPMVALAAQVGVPFDTLQFDTERVNANLRAGMQSLYEQSQNGQVKVAIAQGFFAEAMPRLKDNLVEAEGKSLESNGRQAMMSDRGFFPAEIGIRRTDGSGGYPDQIGVKQILPNEFLAPSISESFSKRTVSSLGADIIAAAEAKGHTLTHTVTPTPEQQPAQQVDSSLDQSKRPSPAMSASI